MKKLLCLILLIIPVAFAFAQNDTLIKIHSSLLNQDREFWVSFPDGYEQNKALKYDVIFIFDAQYKPYLDLLKASLSFKNTAGVQYLLVGDVSPFIQGKYNRNNDLLPDIKDTAERRRRAPYFGSAFAHLDYLEKELVPFLNKNFRTTSYRMAVGHSNGASFILNAIIRNPGLFQSIIAVSPNMACDKEQLVKDFATFRPQKDLSLFIYTTQSNEGNATGFNGWDTAFADAENVFNKLAGDHFYYHHDQFKELNHGTSFPNGLINGLQLYFDNLFSDEQHVFAYLKSHEADLTPNFMNSIAYQLMNKRKTGLGIKVLLQAAKQFPGDLNLYDSIGELYQENKEYDNALKYYQLFQEKLEASKATMSQKDYENNKKMNTERFEKLKQLRK